MKHLFKGAAVAVVLAMGVTPAMASAHSINKVTAVRLVRDRTARVTIVHFPSYTSVASHIRAACGTAPYIYNCQAAGTSRVKIHEGSMFPLHRTIYRVKTCRYGGLYVNRRNAAVTGPIVVRCSSKIVYGRIGLFLRVPLPPPLPPVSVGIQVTR